MAKTAARAITTKPGAGRIAHRAALTTSRPELLVGGSDQQFRKLVHSLFGFLVRHQTLRDGHAAVIGLPGIEYTTLIAIRHLALQGDVHVKTVADHLHLSGAFVTTVTNKLEGKGLIEKAAHESDRRRLSLSVTSRGAELLERLAPTQMQVNDVEFGCLSAREFELLLDLVQRLVDSSDRAIALQRYLADTNVQPIATPSRKSAPKPRKSGKARQVAANFAAVPKK
ncbi:MarR family transcriptional regulator [Bradyrhizobium sp. BRP22]|uniref:MarR family winged helix-turn-helix transcriptional regulator n=1 Tax=Bradyrhizobium sp. BRP22 TaxID=2793821 RepID=UPI001CD7F104|nr:MarR family transcriptional regulator [Bradyrhizobium sp. BRP22]MCA1454399.1 MarR family transcriptional regulator [Bradyrhizobium sp. BRP22]